MPKGEQILWQKLRRKQLGYKFWRQYGVGEYIIDFYCPQLRLAVEVDGITHEDPQNISKDKERALFLHQKGIVVIRFNSKEIFKGIEGVCEKIYFECKKRNENISP